MKYAINEINKKYKEEINLKYKKEINLLYNTKKKKMKIYLEKNL